MAKRVITLPLHMKKQIEEKARIACDLEGKKQTPENLEPHIQQFAYEAYTHALQANPKGQTAKLPDMVTETDYFFFNSLDHDPDPDQKDFFAERAKDLYKDTAKRKEFTKNCHQQFKSILTSLVMLYSRLYDMDEFIKVAYTARNEAGYQSPEDFKKAEKMTKEEKADYISRQFKAEYTRHFRRVVGISYIRMLRLFFTSEPDDVKALLNSILPGFDTLDWKTLKSKEKSGMVVKAMKRRMNTIINSVYNKDMEKNLMRKLIETPTSDVKE